MKNEELEVLQEFTISITAPDVPSPYAAQPSGGMKAVENSDREPPPGTANVLAAYALAAHVVEGEDVDMATNQQDDEWFKPKGSSGGTAVKEASNPRIPAATAPAPTTTAAPRPAARASGISSRVVAPAKKIGSSSARMAAAPTKEMPASEAPVAKAPARSASVRATASGPVAASSTSSSGKSSRRMMPAAKAAPVAPPQEPEIETDAPAEQEQDIVAPGSARMKKSSRRMASSRSSSRSSGSRSSHEERDEKENKKDKRKGGKEKDNTPMYIGVGVVLLLIVGALAMKGGAEKEETVKKAPVEEAYDDKTPSAVYARQAEQALSSGNVSTARDLFTRAANQAEREGNGTQARNYSMKAMTVMKASKRSDR